MPHRSLRPSPLASSRRVLALEFIRRYFVAHGSSPCHREIAAALNIPEQRIDGILRQLEDRGEIRRDGGPRSIRLPDPADELSESDVLLRLRRLGWIVNEDGAAPAPAALLRRVPPVSNPRLSPPAALDDVP